MLTSPPFAGFYVVCHYHTRLLYFLLLVCVCVPVLLQCHIIPIRNPCHTAPCSKTTFIHNYLNSLYTFPVRCRKSQTQQLPNQPLYSLFQKTPSSTSDQCFCLSWQHSWESRLFHSHLSFGRLCWLYSMSLYYRSTDRNNVQGILRCVGSHFTTPWANIQMKCTAFVYHELHSKNGWMRFMCFQLKAVWIWGGWLVLYLVMMQSWVCMAIPM